MLNLKLISFMTVTMIVLFPLIPAFTQPLPDFKNQLPRIRPLSTKEALKAFTIKPGFQIQLVASEPTVVDPIAMSFDADGRLYVIEMRGYSEQSKDLLGRVRLLEDRNDDGYYETSTVFLDKLSWPTAIACYDGGVFIGAAPDILFAKDTNGDGIADVRKRIFTGFGKSNVQGLLNSFRWGLDNRFHAATSSSGGNIRILANSGSTKLLRLGKRDFAFDPRTFKITSTNDTAQHGMSFDDWGKKFVCSNSNHLQMVVFDSGYTARNTRLQVPSARLAIATDGRQADVYRKSRVEPWRVIRTKLRVAKKVPGPIEGGGRAAGYFTGSTGITIARSPALGPDLNGYAIIGDVGSNIVHRKKLISSGLTFRGERVDQNSEFLASSDIWFRPVQFANGPDGALYILDMYREVIEHPKSLPPMLKKHLDLTSGSDRGRIWRITGKGAKHPPQIRLDSVSVSKLVSLLAHPIAWYRETASRLLYERADRSAIPLITKLAASSANPLARLHALYALQGLNALNESLLLKFLADSDPNVRCHAIRQCEPFLSQSVLLSSKLLTLVKDKDIRVRYQLAFSLGYHNSPASDRALARIYHADGHDQWVRLAVFSSIATRADQVLQSFIAGLGQKPSSRELSLTQKLARQIGFQNRPNQIAAVLSVLTDPKQSPNLTYSLLRGLSKGLTEAGSTLANTLKSDQVKAIFARLIRDARAVALDRKRPASQRVSSIQTLALAPWKQIKTDIGALLSPDQPASIQLASIRAMSRFKSPQPASLILDTWPGLTPTARSEAIEFLLSHPHRTSALLTRIEAGKFNLSALDASRRLQLTAHPDKAVAARAKKVITNEAVKPREQVIKAYLPALNLKANPKRGKTQFIAICSACHRAGNVGRDLGPNLAAMAARGPQAILINILDPNREVNPQFVNYIITLKSSQILTGMITSESDTAVTLVRAAGVTQTILRAKIKSIRSTGLSLMPAGLEAALKPQDVADLIAFINTFRK